MRDYLLARAREMLEKIRNDGAKNSLDFYRITYALLLAEGSFIDIGSCATEWDNLKRKFYEDQAKEYLSQLREGYAGSILCFSFVEAFENSGATLESLGTNTEELKKLLTKGLE